MRLPTVPTTPVVEHLNSTYFNQVWNAPDDHGRSNFQLYKAADRLQTGAVPIGLSVVGLPTTDAVYAVYQSYYKGFGRFVTLPEDQWIRSDVIFSRFGVSMVAYGGSGRTVPGDRIWMRYLSAKSMVLVAIDRQYISKCLGESYPDMYMTVYKDTTRSTPIVSSLYTVSTSMGVGTPLQTVLNAITQAKTTYPNGTTVIINGWVYDPNNLPVITAGDIVSIVSDPDVVGYCDVPVDDNLTGYYSDLYEGYREVLHIPKSLNPNNIILTSDTLTTVVFDSATKKGVLGHRVDEHAVESITHNDFSMGRTAIQGFSQSLDAQNVFVRLYVRYPANPNYLGGDVYHLKDLYSLSDEEILKQLLGLSSKQIVEWRASTLETSGFLSLLYRFNGFKSDSVIQQYTDAMGYYDVASVLGQQMRFYTYKGAQVQIIKPARLFGYDCQAIVYANGKKVPENRVGISNYKTNSFLLGFTADSGVNLGDRIAVYIVEAGYRTPIPYNPTSSAPAIVLENEDYSLYQVYTYVDNQPIWKGNTKKGYKYIPLSPADYSVTVNSNGTVTFQVKNKNLDKNFYLVPKYGLNTAQYKLRPTLRNKAPIVVALTTVDKDGLSLPLIGYETMEVYLNGYRLIEGLDYDCKPVKGPNGDTLQNLMTVCNYDYLDLDHDHNQLEVVVHGDKVASEDKGYAIENLLHRTAVPMIWTRSSSRCFVHGVLQETVSESGNIVVTGQDVENGSPFLMQYMLSFGAEKLMKEVSPNLDINLRSRIENVLGIIPPEYPDTVIVNHLYALYSTFLAQITRDVSDGTLKIVDEVKDDRFLKQFSAYTLLMERDPVVKANNKLIERQFVTLAAHYTNLPTDDPTQMIRLQRLNNLVLNPSELSIEEVLL